MFTTFITDCKDYNARARQESRISSLLHTNTSFIGVDSDLEAGMQLIDILDATEGRPGIILVNVAPRGGHATKWENGTPFGYFWYQKTLIVASVDGYALSAVKALGIASEISLLDTHSAAAAMLAAGFITPAAATHIPLTQFRSFDFTPRVAAFIYLGNHVPTTPYTFENVPDLPLAIWHIDSFGNCKTTLRPEQISSEETETRYGKLPFITQLRQVTDGTAALVRGSSGIGDARFLELMVQKGNFALTHGAHIGDDVFTNQSYFVKAT